MLVQGIKYAFISFIHTHSSVLRNWVTNIQTFTGKILAEILFLCYKWVIQLKLTKSCKSLAKPNYHYHSSVKLGLIAHPYLIIEFISNCKKFSRGLRPDAVQFHLAGLGLKPRFSLRHRKCKVSTKLDEWFGNEVQLTYNDRIHQECSGQSCP